MMTLAKPISGWRRFTLRALEDAAPAAGALQPVDVAAWLTTRLGASRTSKEVTAWRAAIDAVEAALDTNI